MPARGVAALELQDDLPLLLLSAAALPVSWQCSLIPVYRQSPQCGERSNAAFGRQSAAEQTSLAPHDSKARLQDVTICRRFMAKPCTPHLHCAARAALQDRDCQCVGSRGKAAPVALHESKGIFSFAKENIPFGTPRERLRLAVSGLNNSDVSEVKVPRARRCRISVAIRFDLLLLSAAALPIL